jgi:hypothetical protein
MGRKIHSHDPLFSNENIVGLSLANYHIIPNGQLADQESTTVRKSL